MTNPVPTHAPKTDTPARPRKQPSGSWGGEVYLVRDVEDYVSRVESTLAAERASREKLETQVAGMKRGPEFYATTPGAISDERLEGMIDETRWWKVPGDEVYEVVRELRALRASRLQAEEALREIADFKGRTLIGHPREDGASYSTGANAAFERCAGIALDALSKPSVSPEQGSPEF